MRLLALLTVMIALAPGHAGAAGNGDVTGDSLPCTAADLALLNQHLLGTVTLTTTQTTNAELNGDSKVDVADVVAMVNRLKGTIAIDVTPDSGTWTLTGPAGFKMIQGSGDRVGLKTIITDVYGSYKLVCNGLSNYTAPTSLIKTLARGASIHFTPIYMAMNPHEITLTLPGGVPLELVQCPAGSFMMGSPDSERSRMPWEGPVHLVTFNRPFYIGKYEVTQAQWTAVKGDNPAAAPGIGDNYPVNHVCWNDIADTGGFLEKLNEYLMETGQRSVRLPSEAEWEYACRAGTRTRFYFGDSLSTLDDSFVDGPTDSKAYPGNRSDYMWFGFSISNPEGCKPVGTKLPNAFGLYDMAGNVSEWCQDWVHLSFSGAPADGSAWEVQQSSYPYRVVRNGNWGAQASMSRSAYRNYQYPHEISRNNGLGFRLAQNDH